LLIWKSCTLYTWEDLPAINKQVPEPGTPRESYNWKPTVKITPTHTQPGNSSRPHPFRNTSEPQSRELMQRGDKQKRDHDCQLLANGAKLFSTMFLEPNCPPEIMQWFVWDQHNPGTHAVLSGSYAEGEFACSETSTSGRSTSFAHWLQRGKQRHEYLETQQSNGIKYERAAYELGNGKRGISRKENECYRANVRVKVSAPEK